MAVSGIQARADALDKIGTEILARREELGTLLSREEGKTRPEGSTSRTRAARRPFPTQLPARPRS
jgi:acyl-CoA reductase-like NAD-dependent aldehyde dehydrogenase